MREFCISIGGHLTSGGLKLGNHTTSGVIDLFNLLSHLYGGFEAAVVPDASSGACLLRKSSVLESAVAPELPSIRSLLYAFACAENGCEPCASAVEDTILHAFGRLGADIVPEAALGGRLSCAASGENAILVSVDPVNPFVMRVLGDVFSGVAVKTESVRAGLKKSAGAEAALCPVSEAQAAAKKDCRGEEGVEVSVSAAGRVVRYRKLYEADPMTLEEMDSMTLEELDLIYSG